jgi:hypothetical protein
MKSDYGEYMARERSCRMYASAARVERSEAKRNGAERESPARGGWVRLQLKTRLSSFGCCPSFSLMDWKLLICIKVTEGHYLLLHIIIILLLSRQGLQKRWQRFFCKPRSYHFIE